jgi:hypothetical protein
MNSPTARFVVLAPTVLLSMGLSSVGYPPLPRMGVCVAFGALMILLVARYRRRRALGSRA